MCNLAFQLCCRGTAVILIGFSFIVTCRLFLGDSFACLPIDDLPPKYLDAKCYQSGVDSSYPSALVKDAATIGPIPSALGEGYRRHQSHYAWVNLFFLVQAFFFCSPYLFMKFCYSEYIGDVTSGLRKTLIKEEKLDLELTYLARYLLSTIGSHKRYVFTRIFLELCNCAISVAQTILLVNFFDVTGAPGGLEVKNWSEYRNFYFPPSGACRFERFGPSGNAISANYRCVLPLNELYMMMFVFLYAWYIFMICITGAVLLYRVAMLSPHLRVLAMCFFTPSTKKSTVKPICLRLPYSDYFFLTAMSTTMAKIHFSQLLNKVLFVSERKEDDQFLQLLDKVLILAERKDDDQFSELLDKSLAGKKDDFDPSATSAV